MTLNTSAVEPSTTAIVEWLIEEFEHAFQEEIWLGDRRTIFFWYDPQREWSAVIPLLVGRIPLIVDRGSLLEVRYELEQRDEKEPVILYLHRTPDQSTYLTPYEFVGRTLSLAPYDLLRRHGVPLFASGANRQELQLLIPQLLATSLGQGEIFWQSMSSLKDARSQLLGGNFQEQMFRFLAAPSAMWSELSSQRKEQFFIDEIQQRYGYSNPGVDAEKFARGLIAYWCLIDLFVQYGEPANFPARDILPPLAFWTPSQATLRSLLNDRRFSAALIQVIRDVEQQYQGAVEWTRKQQHVIVDPAFPEIAKIAYSRAIEQIAACQGSAELLVLLRNRLPFYKEARQSFWSQHGVVPGWHALAEGAEVVIAADAASHHGGSLTDQKDFVESYTSNWANIDLQYRRYRQLPESNNVAAPLSRWVEQIYRRYLEQVNRSWTAALTREQTWPPQGTIEPQWTLWASIENGKDKERRAVFFVDALRYDVALEVAAILEQDTTINLDFETRYASLPSVTPLGMSALLPKAASQLVAWEGEWSITASRVKGNLAEKHARVALLQQHLTKAEVFSLEALLQSQTKPADAVQWLLVFSQEIDEIGENASEVILDTLGSLVQRLAQGVRKALDGGFTTIHIVTDHGFLFLNQVHDSDKINVPDVQVIKLGQRYLIGKELPEHPYLLRFPVRSSDNLWGYYPPGIAAFVTSGKYNYSHGGVTLHEVVIPYLVARRTQVQRRIDVRLVMPEQIHNAIFKIELHPLASNMFDLERDVRIALERSDGTRLREVEEVVSASGSVTKNLRLAPADRISRGSTIMVVVRDTKSGEELDRKFATVQVELEL